MSNKKLKNNNSNALAAKDGPFKKYYKIKGVAGCGANGEILLCKLKNKKTLCKNKKNNNLYAVKKLLRNKNSQNEIDLHWLALENCDNIVDIVDLYVSDEHFYLVLEYLEEGELFNKIKEKKSFTEREAAEIMHQICKAVSHLHSLGIAHRDLKPENLLITSKSGKSIIKLADFGIAKKVHTGEISKNQRCTHTYVAPEIISFQKYDISCDIWSLGVIMYILCCGYAPFYSINGLSISPGMEKLIKEGQFEFPEEDWSKISQDAKDLISGMLKVNPEERLKIEEIMNSDWILNHLNVPKMELKSMTNLKKVDLDEFNQKIKIIFEEMRVNDNEDIKLKLLDEAKNNLLEKRKNKNKLYDTKINDASMNNETSISLSFEIPSLKINDNNIQPIKETNYDKNIEENFNFDSLETTNRTNISDSCTNNLTNSSEDLIENNSILTGLYYSANLAKSNSSN